MIEEVKVFSDLTSTGALMWVVYYCLAKAIPNIIDKADKRNADQITQFLAEIKDQREAMKNELAAERAHCTEELRIVRDNEKENRKLLLDLHSDVRTLIKDRPQIVS